MQSKWKSIKFRKGDKTLFYKTNFDNTDFTELNFLQATAMKKISVVQIASCRTVPRGITNKRKMELLQKLEQILPPNRINFWKELPENVAQLIENEDLS